MRKVRPLKTLQDASQAADIPRDPSRSMKEVSPESAFLKAVFAELTGSRPQGTARALPDAAIRSRTD